MVSKPEPVLTVREKGRYKISEEIKSLCNRWLQVTPVLERVSIQTSLNIIDLGMPPAKFMGAKSSKLSKPSNSSRQIKLPSFHATNWHRITFSSILNVPGLKKKSNKTPSRPTNLRFPTEQASDRAHSCLQTTSRCMFIVAPRVTWAPLETGPQTELGGLMAGLRPKHVISGPQEPEKKCRPRCPGRTALVTSSARRMHAVCRTLHVLRKQSSGEAAREGKEGDQQPRHGGGVGR